MHNALVDLMVSIMSSRHCAFAPPSGAPLWGHDGGLSLRGDFDGQCAACPHKGAPEGGPMHNALVPSMVIIKAITHIIPPQRGPGGGANVQERPVHRAWSRVDVPPIHVGVSFCL